MTDKTVDIVALIRDHPLTRLNGEYNSQIVNKIKDYYN